MFNLKKAKEEIQQQKGQLIYLEQRIQKNQKELKKTKIDLKHTEKAKAVLKQGAIDTQRELEYHINNTVSAALKTVFNEPYEFVLEFVERRGKTEADLYFTKDGNRLDPFSGAGLGVVDIASLALRIVCREMSRSKHRNILLLDEPFKHLSSDLQVRASILLKELSKRTGTQIIYITHVPNAAGIVAHADKVLKVKNIKGISNCTEYTSKEYIKLLRGE